MANEQNLKPNELRTPSERRELAQKAGRASGKKRREQKVYKDLLNAILNSKVKNNDLKTFAETYGIKNPDIKTLTLLGMVRASINGNPNAFDRLYELTGEKKSDDNGEVLARLDKVIGDIDAIADE